MIGESRVTNLLLKMIGEKTLNDIDNYIKEVCSRNFIVISSEEQVRELFDENISNFVSSLSMDELMDLRSYTGYNYKFINAILRGSWKYERHGLLTNEQRIKYSKLAYSVSSVLDKFQIPNIDFITFRGTTLNFFSSYGINELKQLEILKGRFIYDAGFTSTSILEESSYFNKTLDDGRWCNVGIRYLIPSDSNDGALLINDDLSYSTNQNEFLLNSGALTKVMDVSIDEANNTAILTVVLIPKKIYDKGYNNTRNGSRNI